MATIIESLKGHSLFRNMNEAELEDIASVTDRKSYKIGHEFFQQGDEAEYFYIITKGQLELLREDEKGNVYPISYLYPDEFCGDVALLYDEPYNGTVRAMEDSEALVIHKDDFLRLLEDHKKFDKNLEKQGRDIEKRATETFEGQIKGEMILYFKRRHWMALVQRFGRVLFILVLWALVLLFAYALFQDNEENWILARNIGIMFLMVPAGLVLWQIVDWMNDYYIVTNERVIKIEKVIALLNERYEIPLIKIQNVTDSYPTPVGEIFGYGTVTITTSARKDPKRKNDPGGLLVLDYMPNAEHIASRILKEQNREKQRVAQRQTTEKRNAIRKKLGIKDEAANAPKANSKTANTSKPVPKPSRWARFRRWLSNKSHFFVPSMRDQQGDSITWRKHWIILWRDWTLPLSSLVILMTIIWFAEPWLIEQEITIGTIWAVTILIIFLHTLALGWFYEDWRNDTYVLNKEGILDEQKLPLFFQKKVRRAPLEAIQDIRFMQRNPLWVWLRVGHVIIQTAGEDGDFTFYWVYNPRQVQSDVFRYIRERKLQRRKREVAVINQEVLDILKIYDEERQTRPPAPAS